jgi:hypothetical protein
VADRTALRNLVLAFGVAYDDLALTDSLATVCHRLLARVDSQMGAQALREVFR